MIVIFGTKRNNASTCLSLPQFDYVRPEVHCDNISNKKITTVPFRVTLAETERCGNFSRYFYWPNMGPSVRDFVKTCESFQRSKSSRNKVGLLHHQPLPVPEPSVSLC